jgi:hypothetical protein
MAWLGTYAHRVKVTASNTNVDADLTQFPLLLKLGTSVGTGANDVSFVFDELTSDANRKKIAVTDTTGDTQLYVEIEKWDDTNESAILWVSKSDWVLDHDANTELYLYYDVAQADNDTYVADVGGRTEVWDSGYEAVYHLSETGDGTAGEYIDSTSHNNDGRGGGGTSAYVPTKISAKIGDGQDFDGNDYVSRGRVMTSTDNYTLEAWVKPDSISQAAWFMHHGTGNNGMGLLIGNAELGASDKFTILLGGITWIETGSTFSSTANWYHIVGQRISGTTKGYLNGVVCANTSALTPLTPTDYFKIGSGTHGATFAPEAPIDGKIDEVRISSVARSAAHIKANYYSETDALVSWGTEESNVSGPANLKSYNTNLKANIKSINTNLLANIKSLNTNI